MTNCSDIRLAALAVCEPLNARGNGCQPKGDRSGCISDAELDYTPTGPGTSGTAFVAADFSASPLAAVTAETATTANAQAVLDFKI